MKKLALTSTLLILFAGFATASPQISTQLMSTEPSPMQIGEYADVRFKVSNTGDDAKNVSVEFVESYPFSVDPGDKKRWTVTDLESGDTFEFRVPVRVNPSALQGEEELEVRTGTDGNTRTHRLPVQIKADDDGLFVEEVDFPERVGSGTSSEMNITLRNTANAHFRNVEVSLGFNQQTPMVASGTTRKRVGSIGPGETRNVVYTINVDESAENGVYSLPINLNYENEAGAPQSKSQDTGIVVGGQPQIEVGLNQEGEIQAGSSGTVTYRFVNRGEGTAKFVKVEFMDGENFSIRSGSSVYLGDMNPDDYQTAETEIYTEPGTDSVQVPVELTYRENGEEKTVTRNVDVDILSGEELQRYGGDSSTPFLLIGAVAVVGIAGVIYWRRRR
jgi:LPXTG-motif cell wall-anchored protein